MRLQPTTWPLVSLNLGVVTPPFPAVGSPFLAQRQGEARGKKRESRALRTRHAERLVHRTPGWGQQARDAYQCEKRPHKGPTGQHQGHRREGAGEVGRSLAVVSAAQRLRPVSSGWGSGLQALSLGHWAAVRAPVRTPWEAAAITLLGCL